MFAFVLLGSGVLLAYVAWRIGEPLCWIVAGGLMFGGSVQVLAGLVRAAIGA